MIEAFPKEIILETEEHKMELSKIESTINKTVTK